MKGYCDNSEKCKTCKYKAGEDAMYKCNYITIVGHSRGCEPGNKCTKYKRGKKIENKNIINFDRSGKMS